MNVPHTIRLSDQGLGAFADEPEPLDPSLDPDMAMETMEDGATVTQMADGSSIVDFGPAITMRPEDVPFGGNLADVMTSSELAVIAMDLLEGIQSDIDSRAEWEETNLAGIDLLGLTLETPTGDINPMGSVSKVYHPLLLEAVLRYQSTTMAELLPANGPVKVKDAQPTAGFKRDEKAEALEKDFNHYLTAVAKEYYPDFDRMLFLQGFSGCVFRKVYRCPLRRRPVSEFVSGMDFIISNNAVSLTDCGRKTHRIKMTRATMRRMQLTKNYRDVPLIPPQEEATGAEAKIKEIEGRQPTSDRPDDQRHTVYECYADLDLDAFPHLKEDGEPSGLPLPYKVTIDKDSQEILEIRRNWVEGDPDYLERVRFVKYGLFPGLGYYDYGYVHILGQSTRALTAIERQLIDAGQFANFPGFLVANTGARQDTNQMRVPPGAGFQINTGGQKIQDIVLPLPYKEPSVVLASIAEKIAEDARRMIGQAEIAVGEGRQDAPVGTTIAMIEQAVKVTNAVHKRNHTSQQQEFEIMKQLFAEDPTALWRYATTPARKWEMAEEFKDINLVPASDPNVSSHMQRVMRAVGIKQMAAENPQLYNIRKVDSECLKILGIQDPETMFNPPPPAPDPRIAELGMAYVKAETDKATTDAQKNAAEAQRASAEAQLYPMKTIKELTQEDLKINVSAFKEGMGAINAAAKEPPGYATGGRIYVGADPSTPPVNNDKMADAFTKLADAIDRMSGPRRKTVRHAPRDSNGQINFEQVEMIDEPWDPTELPYTEH